MTIGDRPDPGYFAVVPTRGPAFGGHPAGGQSGSRPTGAGLPPSSGSSTRPGRGRLRLVAGGIVAAVVVAGRLVLMNGGEADPRPLVLPVTLDGLEQVTDDRAVEEQQEVDTNAATWWPGRGRGIAFYTSDSTRLNARLRQLGGPRVLAVRGRFEDKGDARFFERAPDEIDKKLPYQTHEIGAVTCQVGAVAVCWRESDDLSVSVLNLLEKEPGRTAAQVEEIWTGLVPTAS